MKLEDKLEESFRINELQKKGLKKLGILSVSDLLYYFPARYVSSGEVHSISNLIVGEKAVVFGKITNLEIKRAFRKKIPMAKGFIEDTTGSIEVIWFNQPYIAKIIHEGSLVKVEGMVSEKNGKFHISNPTIEEVAKISTSKKESLFGEDGPELTLYPVYPETRGITSLWIYHTIQKIFKFGMLEKVFDPIPVEILKKYNLPSLKSALVWIHAPQNENDRIAAIKRFAFQEIFLIQISKMQERKRNEKEEAYKIEPDPKEIESFVSRFSFLLTSAQKKAIKDIFSDFKKGRPMSRLLEGDVGSGKTAVAASAIYAATITEPKGQNFGRLQSAYMAPTEILARQHFYSFIKYFSHMPINIALITGSGCEKFPSKINPLGTTRISRAQLLKWVSNGEIPILIGTHALIEKSVKFKNLGLVIIDEQHRFGTKQRQKLAKKENVVPHLLSMTATPIPRTLALTLYGDLDLTLLDEMPAGRKVVKTEIVLPNEREKIYEEVKKELREGRQVYVICPRINEPDPEKEKAVNAKSVKEEAKRLKKDIFKEYEIGIMHSKMKPSEKEKVMKDFENKKIDILVSTSVIEVGVNVPNATVIIIEGAERFGLSQLHQLRGRVLRSDKQAYCFVFANTKSEKTIERLKALKTAKNGFELSEMDLKLRGAGELYGNKQWGLTDIAMNALKNIKMVEAARFEAQEMIEKDLELISFPLLRNVLETKKDIHFE